ncbi:MAG: 3-dehydroquinate synthase [Treponema sp.]|nr:MAG: 3-dehydroquinate synthase [Treponema sp.]
MEKIIFEKSEVYSTVHFLHSKELVFEKTNSLLVVDSNTKHSIASGIDSCIVIPAGDENKNLAYTEKIIQKALSKNLDRNSVFYAVGGGMVCDITAFAASIYKRGVRCRLIPTSLLAMVDASVGGKTGINIGSVKNAAGSFYPCEHIYICPDFLKTLPMKEMHSGLAEIFKIGLIESSEIFKIMSLEKQACTTYDENILKRLIRLAITSKAKIVQSDFLENAERRFLNFGHTFGHALESFTCFNVFSHGEAVAWGIAQALKLGVILNLTDKVYAQTVLDLLKFYNWETKFIPDKLKKLELDNFVFCNRILDYIANDKKNKNGKINLVLQKQLNENFIYQTDKNELLIFFKGQLKNE